MKRILTILLLSSIAFGGCNKHEHQHTTNRKVLVFTGTNGFRHESIDDGLAMFRNQAATWQLDITDTGNANAFTDEFLGQYQLIVLLNTTGTLFSPAGRLALQSYIRKGGALLAIHAAADAEYGWPWYGQMLGAWFDSHPAIQSAGCHVVMPAHPSVQGIPPVWKRMEEWYNFKSLQTDNQLVLTVDESTYSGGTHGALHPVSWYRHFDGGRIFYTSMGHTKESYSETLFVQHIGGAIGWLLTP